MTVNFNKSLLAIICKIASALLSFVYIWFVTKILTIEDAGVFLYTFNLMLIIVQFSRAGTESSMIVSIASNNTSPVSISAAVYNTFFYVAIICFFVNSIVLFLAFWGFYDIYNDDSAFYVLKIFVVSSFVFAITQVLATYFQSVQSVIFQYWFLNIGISLLGSLFILFGYLYVGYVSVEFASLLFLISTVVLLLTILLARSFNSGHGFICSLRNMELKNFFKFTVSTLPYAPITFLTICMLWGSQILSAKWLSPAELAVCAVAVKIAYLTHFAHISLSALVMPSVAKVCAINRQDLILENTIRSNAISKIFSICVFIFYVLFGDYVLTAFGDEYAEGYLTVVIMSGCWVLISFIGPVNSILLMSKNTNFVMIALVISIFCTFSLSFMLIEELRLIGVAISTSVASIMLSILCAFRVRYLFGVSFYTISVNVKQINYIIRLIIKR